MIKRDGVTIKSCTTNNSSAKEIIKVLEAKQYTAPSGKVVDISNSLDDAVKNSRLFRSINPCSWQKVPKTTLEVTTETTTAASVRLLNTDPNVVALNFASARNPGGGFLSGAVAQEEDLCRASGLYFCVKNKPMFYNDNVLCPNTLYTDNIIYSPQVPFFKDDSGLYLENPYLLSIVSAPAPNLRSIENIDQQLLYDTILGRAIKILHIAAVYGHKTIVLGAWGCGAFGNDPENIAYIFLEALSAVPAFEHVCFAIYDKRPLQPVYETFRRVIEIESKE